MEQALIWTILGAPALAVLALLARRRLGWAGPLNAAAAWLALAAAGLLLLRGGPAHPFAGGLLLVDGLDRWVLFCVAVVYALSSVYAVGYMRLLPEEAPRLASFYALFAGFAGTMLLACLVNNIGLYWIAVELTTLVSTFLVGFEASAESTEAAWKYIVVVSAGISLALLGTILYYWGGTFVLGPRYSMTWASLAQAAPRMNPVILALSFLLVLVGYGTKVGLAPMHTWLPDAHSESPAPVSALLSGGLLNTALLGIIRFQAAMENTAVRRLCHLSLIGLGLWSFVVGALFITRQRGIKRLMAYSSVEHMGILALGFGFGGPLGIAGGLYHMLNHSLNKSLMFFGAGNAMRVCKTKQIRRIRGVLRLFPVTGILWAAGAAGIAGAPPFGTFVGEFTILRAGVRAGYAAVAVLMAILMIVVFVAFMAHFRRMIQPPGPQRSGGEEAGLAPLGGPEGRLRTKLGARSRAAAPEEAPAESEAAAAPAAVLEPEPESGAADAPARLPGWGWRAAAMWLAFVPLLALGLWWPARLWTAFLHIAAQLGARP